MTEAGYSDGFDVELATDTRERRRAEAIVIQDNLAKIGIRAKINLMQGSQFFEKFRKQGFQICINGWTADYSDADANANAFANYKIDFNKSVLFNNKNIKLIGMEGYYD